MQMLLFQTMTSYKIQNIIRQKWEMRVCKFIIINKRADKRHRVRTRKMHLKINNKREWIKTSSIPKKMLFKETKNIISNILNNKKNCFFKSWLSQIFFIFLGFFYFDLSYLLLEIILIFFYFLFNYFWTSMGRFSLSHGSNIQS